MNDLEKTLSQIDIKPPSKQYLAKADSILNLHKQGNGKSYTKWLFLPTLALSLTLNVLLFVEVIQQPTTEITQTRAQNYQPGYSIEYGVSHSGEAQRNLTKRWDTE